MFRKMRRKDKEMDKQFAYELLSNCDEGYFSTISVDTGHPYIVCVNHYFDGEAIYFHCANEGHKIDNILADDKVSFMVTNDIEILQEKYATKYKSAIVFGRAFIIEDKKIKKDVLYNLSNKFVGNFISKFTSEMASAFGRTSIVKIEIEHITAKRAK